MGGGSSAGSRDLGGSGRPGGGDLSQNCAVMSRLFAGRSVISKGMDEHGYLGGEPKDRVRSRKLQNDAAGGAIRRPVAAAGYGGCRRTSA